MLAFNKHVFIYKPQLIMAPVQYINQQFTKLIFFATLEKNKVKSPTVQAFCPQLLS